VPEENALIDQIVGKGSDGVACCEKASRDQNGKNAGVSRFFHDLSPDHDTKGGEGMQVPANAGA
jgi:hypothetical protein